MRGPGDAHQVHRVPFPVPAHSFVRLRVFCVSGGEQHHWVAWLRDEASGRAVQIGRFSLICR